MIDSKQHAENLSIVEQSPLSQYVYTPYLKEWLLKAAPTSVLDLYCGKGFYSRIAKQSSAEHVLGIHSSEAMITKAQYIERLEPLNVQYKKADALTFNMEQCFSATLALWLVCTLNSNSAIRTLAHTMFKHTEAGGKAIVLFSDRSRNHTNKSSYDATWKTADKLCEGDPFEVTISNNHHTITFEDYHWYPETVTSALISAGFSEVSSHFAEVSQQGLDEKEEGYWQEYQRHPFIVFIEAEK